MDDNALNTTVAVGAAGERIEEIACPHCREMMDVDIKHLGIAFESGDPARFSCPMCDQVVSVRLSAFEVVTATIEGPESRRAHLLAVAEELESRGFGKRAAELRAEAGRG